MNKTKRIVLIVLCCIMIALCTAGVIWAFVNKFNQTAEAEYLDIYENENAVVNFNQIVENNYINNSYNANSFTNVAYNIIQGHKYYIRSNSSNNFVMYFWTSGTPDVTQRLGKIENEIVTANNNFDRFLIHNNTSGVITISNLNCIDLTACFGSGQEPNLQEATSLFTAPYYYYNTGTPMSIYGVNYYNAAYNDFIEALTYKLDLNALSNTTFAYKLNNQNASFDYNNTNWYITNCIGIPLQTTLTAGAFVTINTSYYAPNIANNYWAMCVGYLDENNNMIEISNSAISMSVAIEYSLTLPVSLDTIYIYFRTTSNGQIDTSANMLVYNLTIKANQLDINSLVINSKESGRKIGYETGYQAGYNKGIADQSATLGTMQYIGAAFSGIGEILQIELLPNIPFSLFIILPLMFGLITFVVKLTKGGGGD